ncbi:hypothetical protein LWI28_026055 [Acer negundo]|uniref:Uncharacterized protein n=1 Tax=Acer negundo TaxID=4023 RepID=A0AAD5JNX4_ACENE|nr:hypothetical protein LWI28_026055 [Acer negundo]
MTLPVGTSQVMGIKQLRVGISWELQWILILLEVAGKWFLVEENLGLNVPTKVKIFSWKACHEWLPTMEKNVVERDVKQTQVNLGPNMNADCDRDSSSESGFDNGAVAESDSPILKTRSLADVYERCNMMINESSCYEEAAQMDE